MLNKAEKAVEQYKLDQEKAVLKKLVLHYEYALKGINERLQVLQAAPETQSKVYQKQYQETLKKQVSGILERLHSDVYSSLDQYMHDSYTTGFVGTMYDLHYQNVPLLIPINQDAILKAVQHDTKLTSPLYDELGIDTKRMSRFISREISRGLASGLTYDEVSRNIKNVTRAPLSRAKVIARTEGHRIQQASSQDAAEAAKAKGADIVKQWDATLDGDTRTNHRQLDGQIRELDEPFEVAKYKPMYPGDFGDPGEDCNCRCVSLKRARAALDEDELKTLRERAVRHSLYADDPEAFRKGKLPALKSYEEFQKSYLKAAEAEQKVVPSTIEELQSYSERILGKHGVQVSVEGAGRYLEAATENVEWLDELLTEYNSTIKKYSVSSVGFSEESGATVYFADKVSGMRVSPSSFNPRIDVQLRNIPDAKKKLVTTTHEFGHTLSKSEIESDSAFWKEIASVRTKYRKALKDIEKAEHVTHSMSRAEAEERRNGIFISDYANKNLDEFLGDSFAHAKLSESPSPFAVAVLEIVDKYFKK